METLLRLRDRLRPWLWHDSFSETQVVRFGLAIVFVFVFVFGTWAVFAPLSGAVIAGGTIKVDMERKLVQHQEGGIVKEILVRNGDRVRQGQTLVVLEDERVSSSADLLAEQLDAETIKVARLRAERDEADKIGFPPEFETRKANPKIAEILASEQHLFEVRRKTLQDQTRLLNAQIAEARHEIAGAKLGVQAEKRAIGYSQEELAANERLYDAKFIAKTRLLGLKRDMAVHEGKHSEYATTLARAGQNVAELQRRIVELRANYVQGAANDLGQSANKILDLQERLRPFLDAMTRQRIVAPVTGEVVNLKVFTAGGVIGPREPLMEVVPFNKELVVEAHVAVDDIDEVRPDMEAEVRLIAYKQRNTPYIGGKVIYVSADRLMDEATKAPYYAALVRVDPKSLRHDEDIKLYPGMPAEIFIKTRERTMLDYLLEPVTGTLRRSLRET